jgi:hypothetical protein
VERGECWGGGEGGAVAIYVAGDVKVDAAVEIPGREEEEWGVCFGVDVGWRCSGEIEDSS